MLALKKLVANPERTRDVFIISLVKAFVYLTRRLPELAHYVASEPTPFVIPLSDLMPNLPHLTEEMATVFESDDPASLGLFRQVEDNPFDLFLSVELPFDIPMQTRGEHTAIVAGSGHGKTQLLLTIAAKDIERDDPPGMVILDSTGAMIDTIQQLDCFAERVKDRILILDPRDDPAPALNMLDLAMPRRYSRRERQALDNEIVKLFAYIFTSAGTPITSLMSGPFAYIIQLALTIPHASLDTVRGILEDKPKEGYAASKFRDHIEDLDYDLYKTTIDFFRNRYYAQSMDRRNQMADRIDAILQNPIIAEMLNAPVNRVDFFEELNKGTIILVNTSQEYLKDDSTFCGRYIIARTMAAAFERASLPRNARKQAFLIVDEAAPYFDDDQFATLLTRVRQYGLGVTIAFQDLAQAGAKLQNAIANSAAVKFAGGIGHEDARWLGRQMGHDIDFMMAQKRQPGRSPKWTKFACYARGLTTDGAISLTVPFGEIDALPKMTKSVKWTPDLGPLVKV
jgi:TraM recognition site of TraD and TraG